MVEYFDRRDLGLGNPTDYGAGAHFIHSCSPEGEGRELLLAKLALIHPAVGGTLVCIDFSESFSSKRNQALEELRHQVIRSGSQYVDEVICFAGSAECRSGFREWLERGGDIFKSLSLVSGTRAKPLTEAVRQVMIRCCISEVAILTDGEFDVNSQEVIDEITCYGIGASFLPAKTRMV